MKVTQRMTQLLLAGACLALAAPALAQAPATTPATAPAAAPAAAPADQPAPAAEPAAEEEIVITGSRIKGTAENTALPVDTIGTEELSKRGAPSTLDLIKTLPVSGPVIGDTNQFSGVAQGNTGAGSLNLRSLGPLRNLILLNGRRLPAAPGANSAGVDTQLLPTAAIGRVEVLKDGAAAIYGSDAISGVVNFITRRNLNGYIATADYRYVDGSAGGDYGASLAWGRSRDTWNVLLTLGVQSRGEVSSTDRDWANKPYTVNPSGWSVYSTPGTIMGRTLPNGAGGITFFGADSNCAALGGAIGATGTTPVCRFTYVPFDNIVEKEQRLQAYGEFNIQLDDTTKFHAEVLYAKTVIPKWRTSPAYPPFTGLNGPSTSSTFTVPIANPGAVTALQQGGASAPAIAGTQSILLVLYRPLANGGHPSTGGSGGQTDRIVRDLWRVSGGFTGEFDNGIGWDVALTYSETTASGQGPDILAERLQKALNGLGGPNCTGIVPGANGCQWFNPFSNALPGNPALGLTNPGFVSANANNPALVDWLYDRQVTQSTQTLFVADASVNGELGWELGGGKVGWALGAQYRETSFRRQIFSKYYDANVSPCAVEGVTNCTVKTGPYIFLGQAVPVDISQSVYAFFGELSLPFSDSLNAQLALRYENYGGLTGSTLDPKFAFKWQVNDWLAFRGSVGTTFRGPTTLNTSGGTVTGLQSLPAVSGGFRAVDTLANPNLKPEKATTFNFGAIIEKGGFRALIDYWRFDLTDQITAPTGTQVSNAVFLGAVGNTELINCSAALIGRITFDNPTNTCVQGTTAGTNISRVRTGFVNGPDVTTSGIDLTVDYLEPDVGGGDLGLGFSLSYVIDYHQAEFILNGVTLAPGYDAVGYTNYDRSQQTISKWRGTAYVEYTYDIHNFRLTANYASGVDDNRNPEGVAALAVYAQTGAQAGGCVTAGPNCTLVTFGQHVRDNLTFDFTYRVDVTEDVQVSLSAFNILDRDPSAARLELSYDPFLGSPLGRNFKIGINAKF